LVLPGPVLASYSDTVNAIRGGTVLQRGENGRNRDLVAASNFIRAVRESGYVSLSTALAELIDNSLQADARTIAVTVARPHAGGPHEIEVRDDGQGMNGAQLAICLQFGGTARFDDRASFGRFGMGLPAASLSQACHIEVTAWQDGKHPLGVTIDVDSIASGAAPQFRPGRRSVEVTTASGCIVRWSECDRIEYQRIAWLERALHRDLGRMYRRFLQDGLALTINGTPVKAVDPLMLTSTMSGASASLAMEPMRFEVATTSGATSFVDIRFSALPVEAWCDLDNLTKRRSGIVGGGGVSILRAGREIAFGWHLMGGKRKENYDDWWRCEIEFDPTLDEHFGITINKQGIRPSADLREALEPELESIARLLNSRVRRAFEDVKFREATQQACRIAAAAEPSQPPLPRRGRRRSGAPLSYRLTSAQLMPDAMFATEIKHDVLHVTLNIDHPAFSALYRPLQTLSAESDTSDLRTAIELLLLSFCRAQSLDSAGVPDLVGAWSDAYAKMLQKS
jgi:hypothetical protein